MKEEKGSHHKSHSLDLEGEIILVDDDTVGEGELLVGTLCHLHHLQGQLPSLVLKKTYIIIRSLTGMLSLSHTNLVSTVLNSSPRHASFRLTTT